MGGDDRLRLFVALVLPGGLAERLAAWQREHLAGGRARLVPAENLHVTLAFLGDRPASEAAAIAVALREAAGRAGALSLAPRAYRETRSVGMVVLEDARGEAGRLAGDLQERLERLGVYERERRAWLPHVTVLRFRGRPPRLRPPLPELGAFSPSDAALYTSVLRSDGAQHEVVESVALGGR